MIPKLQARGKSFKGSTNYVLHDKKARTSERVDWTLLHNLHTDADLAYYEMADTWENQDALKKNAGVSLRGRKNDKPVLHYTLAWHPDDKPTKEQMQAAALETLGVLGLSEHQAVIVGHSDKAHPHLHIVANTVHPYTGRTADLKYSKEKLSRWAEAYERKNGAIRCEERVVNNELRDEIRDLRANEKREAFNAAAKGLPIPQPSPFIAINAKFERQSWFNQESVALKVNTLRSAHLGRIRPGLRVIKQRHLRERDDAHLAVAAKIAAVRADIGNEFRNKDYYLDKAHRKERFALTAILPSPVARAAYVLQNKERLLRGGPPSLKKLLPLIVSPKRLSKEVATLQCRERVKLWRTGDRQANSAEKTVMNAFTGELQALARRHTAERAAFRSQIVEQAQQYTPAFVEKYAIAQIDAKLHPDVEMINRQPSAPTRDFNEAGWAGDVSAAELQSRAQRIRRDRIAWRLRHSDRDFCLER